MTTLTKRDIESTRIKCLKMAIQIGENTLRGTTDEDKILNIADKLYKFIDSGKTK